MVDRIYSDNSRKRIGHVLNARIHQLEKLYPEYCVLNLAAKTASIEYKHLLKTSVKEISEEDLFIEESSLSIFNDYTDFWCEYEIYKIRSKYKNRYFHEDIDLTYSEDNYKSRIVSDITQDGGLYLTLYEDFLMKLSDAVLLSNLYAFVKEKNGMKCFTH